MIDSIITEERSVIVANTLQFDNMMADLKTEWDEQIVKRGFYHSYTTLITFFRKGELYVQQLKNKKEDTWHDNVVPAFCVYNDQESIVFIWTREDWRRRGIARQFVQHFKVKYTTEILEESKPFWKAMDVKASYIHKYESIV